ncbi:hypothetical protein ATANTOWER_022381 [Ataeniobius toweri]|uniref:EF-hand domain-containing protein n=1 Tax=Ataeniobius toweri TaxID=208326 RepID=A0ABU7BK24_9TELE|nr:hypothetical protein [Ataeniobius toweri]
MGPSKHTQPFYKKKEEDAETNTSGLLLGSWSVTESLLHRSGTASQSGGAEDWKDDGGRQSDSLPLDLTDKSLYRAQIATSTMERQGFPDQDQLLQFLKRLKEVFDVCDEDADGFIRVEHLMDLGLQFGQGDEIAKWAAGE